MELHGRTPDLSRSEVRRLIRAQLGDLRVTIGRAVPSVEDRVAPAHLQDLVARIDRILEESTEATTTTAAL